MFTSNTTMNLAKGQGLQEIKGQKVPGQNQEDNKEIVFIFYFLDIGCFRVWYDLCLPMHLAKGQGLQGTKGQKVLGQNQEDNEKRNWFFFATLLLLLNSDIEIFYLNDCVRIFSSFKTFLC